MGSAASAALPDRLTKAEIEALVREEPAYGQVLARAPWLATKLSQRGHVQKKEALGAWRDFGGGLEGGLAEAKRAVEGKKRAAEESKISKERLCAKFEGEVAQARLDADKRVAAALDRSRAAEAACAAACDLVRQERERVHRVLTFERKKREKVLEENERLCTEKLALGARLDVAEARRAALERRLGPAGGKREVVGAESPIAEVFQAVRDDAQGELPLAVRAAEVEALTAALTSLKAAEEHHDSQFEKRKRKFLSVAQRLAKQPDGAASFHRWRKKFAVKLEDAEASMVRAAQHYAASKVKRPGLLEDALRSLAVDVQRVELKYAAVFDAHLKWMDPASSRAKALKQIARTAAEINAKNKANVDQRPSKAAGEALRLRDKKKGKDDGGGDDEGPESLGFALRLLYDADRCLPHLVALAEGAAQGGLGTVTTPPIKSLKRALQKTHLQNGGRYDRLKDLARCSISCADVEAVATCLARLGAACEIVRVKDRLSSLEFGGASGRAQSGGFDAALKAGGYRDMLLNVKVGLGEESQFHVCEIQIHLGPYLDIKQRGGGHATYEISRTLRASDDEFVKIEGALGAEELSRIKAGIVLQLNCANVIDRPPRSLVEGSQRCRLLDVVLSENALRVDLKTLLGADPVCASLRRLVLNDCALTGPFDVQTLAKLPALRVLLLQDNDLRGPVDVRAVQSNMAALQVLRLNNNPKLSTAGDPDAEALKALQSRCYVDLNFKPPRTTPTRQTKGRATTPTPTPTGGGMPTLRRAESKRTTGRPMPARLASSRSTIRRGSSSRAVAALTDEKKDTAGAPRAKVPALCLDDDDGDVERAAAEASKKALGAVAETPQREATSTSFLATPAALSRPVAAKATTSPSSRSRLASTMAEAKYLFKEVRAPMSTRRGRRRDDRPSLKRFASSSRRGLMMTTIAKERSSSLVAMDDIKERPILATPVRDGSKEAPSTTTTITTTTSRRGSSPRPGSAARARLKRAPSSRNTIKAKTKAPAAPAKKGSPRLTRGAAGKADDGLVPEREKATRSRATKSLATADEKKTSKGRDESDDKSKSKGRGESDGEEGAEVGELDGDDKVEDDADETEEGEDVASSDADAHDSEASSDEEDDDDDDEGSSDDDEDEENEEDEEDEEDEKLSLDEGDDESDEDEDEDEDVAVLL